MAVVNIPFYIEPDVLKMVEAGDYIIHGGVVRWAPGKNGGQIVQMLKPAGKIAQEEIKEVAKQAGNIAKNNKQLAIGIGVGAAVAGLGVGAVALIKEKKRRDRRRKYRKKYNHKKTPGYASAFKSALSDYVEAINSGNMTTEVIDKMINSLKRICDEDGNYKIEFSANEFFSILNSIANYTRQLVDSNSIELTDAEKDFISGEGNTIDFMKCLEIQKRVFEEAA